MPTRAPILDKAMARFTATVVLPTPPLPAPTAITFFTPGSGGLPCSGAVADRTLTLSAISTSMTPATRGRRGARLGDDPIASRGGVRRQLETEASRVRR